MRDEVGSRPEVRGKLTIEVAGPTGRRDNLFIEILRMRRRSTAMCRFTPTDRDEIVRTIRALSTEAPKTVLNVALHILIGSRGGVPAFNDLCEVGWT